MVFPLVSSEMFTTNLNGRCFHPGHPLIARNERGGEGVEEEDGQEG